MARPERLLLLAAALGLWLFTGEGIFLLVAAGTGWRLFTKDLPAEPSWSTLGYYAAVLGALAAVLRALPAAVATAEKEVLIPRRLQVRHSRQSVRLGSRDPMGRLIRIICRGSGGRL